MKEKITLNRVIKLSIIFAVLLIACSVSYYYVVFLPQKHRAETEQPKKDNQAEAEQQEKEHLLSTKERCREAGDKLYQQKIEDLGRDNLLIPEYYYNEGLNTCLYAGGYIKKDYFEKSVEDSLTNKTTLLFIQQTIDGEKRVMPGSFCPECVSSNEEFEARKQELFSK